MKTLDDQIREAYEALDESVPEGYFDTFSSRLEQTLEVQAMAPETPDKSRDKAGGDEPSSKASAKTGSSPRENTGLHDIKAMARTTKERISRRVSTQSDAEESLLVSSSSGLKAVVLPEPGKDQPKYETEAEEKRAEDSEEEARGGLPLWLYGAVGAVAIAAVVFFVVRGRGESKTETASLEPSPQSAVASPGDELDELGVPSAAAEGGLEGADDDVAAEPAPSADDLEPTVSPITPETSGAAGGATSDAVEELPTDVAKRGHRRDRHRPGRSRHDRDDAAEKKPAEKPKADSKPPPPPPTDKAPGGPRSLEDILDTEMGGAPAGAKTDKEKAGPAKKAPTKTELTGSDIRKGMRSVLGRVQACYTQYKKPGTVKVSVSVSPDGAVSEAFAVGEFKGTPTGTCVATAVKSASFPAWDGRTKSFKYSYLLAD